MKKKDNKKTTSLIALFTLLIGFAQFILSLLFTRILYKKSKK